MARIPKSLDKSMDKAYPSGDVVQPGISLRNGPVEEMDVDQPPTKGTQSNGAANGKRKGRQTLSNGKSYKEATSDEEDDKPLVCLRE
jgi:DNA topoisomerase-1